MMLVILPDTDAGYYSAPFRGGCARQLVSPKALKKLAEINATNVERSTQGHG